MTTLLRRGRAKIREINRTYAVPGIEMSRPVRIALVGLRVYLFVLIALSLYKFITLTQ
jgi:hypothetical protein